MTIPHTYIIAEAGVNHNGSLEQACKLIEVAAEAGADAVKFQTFSADRLTSANAPKADYQTQTTDSAESQYSMLKRLELSDNDHLTLIECCEKHSIEFLSTPFDLESIDMLTRLGINTWKIPSGEITNLPYLRKIGERKESVILSTGMSNLREIEDALNALEEAGTLRERITVLHCNTEYPTPIEDVNLRAMQTIGSAFPGIKIGYSDHTLGIEIPIAAVAMGATIVEKHFTLDRNLPGPDHRASLEPNELMQMIQAIRNLEKAMGNGIKRPSTSELKNRTIARKSIVAARKIAKGEKFSPENLTTKRPATGVSPMFWNSIVGKTALKDYKIDEIINA
jgi:N,N'-diacetyllegionaminate synthase